MSAPFGAPRLRADLSFLGYHDSIHHQLILRLAIYQVNMVSGDAEQFHAKDTLRVATTGAGVTGAAGICFAAVQNSLAKSNVGGWGIITRGGGTIGHFSMKSTGLFENLDLD